ncbi:serine/threonine-protein phosphatase 6 regulatory subunit 2 [Talpa occidentalis]|uniref:serine/threonine-protein phosphatase 6 regulatory subunit 2 n=1 Tax=Talpa occidentalis TaxID=50954 RepID=UPI001890A473|nr:serine/threonine-protein phosphatase 6 regulatory subunit 2 [Talpa occidentalis]
MFWKFDLNTTSHVDKLLDKEGVTLRELMDEDDILQECKAQNRRLLDFLCRPQCMEELVSLVTRDPPLDMEEKVRFKYPSTACELLTCDVPQINDRLGGDEALLALLYGFLDHEPPLNPLLASFFSKTAGTLIARKTEQVVAFLRKRGQFVGLVLRHLGTSALMDLLLRLVSCAEPSGLRREVLQWLDEEKTVQRLVELVHPSQDEDRLSNASQTLCDIVRLGREQGCQTQEAPEPDPLLAALQSQDCVEQLLKNMFDGQQTESCLVSGTQVLLTLLDTRRVGAEGLADSFSQGLDRLGTVSTGVLQGIEPRLKDFHQLLLNPPKKAAILTTIGVLEEPLGSARLHCARLVAALLHTNTPSINQELCRLNTMGLLLDLFFKYTWNNFLHFQVELCIAAILSHAPREDRVEARGPESVTGPLPEPGGLEAPPPAPAGCPENMMVTHLFQQCCLVQRILEAWEANDHTQAAGGMRRGNMGHLTRIANAVAQNLERGPAQTPTSEAIRGLPADCRGRWESFVEETLTEANRRNAVDLVSTHHLHPSSEEEDMEGVFPNELSLQQAFSEYQVQQMAAAFVDQFGFNDEEFADQDDSVNAPFDRIAEIAFRVDAAEDGPNAALFEACCGDRIQPFDDDDEDDIWEDRDAPRAARATARARFGGVRVSESGSKNGREGRGSAEADAPGRKDGPRAESGSEGAAWTASEQPAGPPASAPGAAPAETGWAAFPDLQPFCCAESGPRCSSPVDAGSADPRAGPEPGAARARGRAPPSAWSAGVPGKAPAAAAASGGGDGPERTAAAAPEAGGAGPGREAPPRPAAAPRAPADATSPGPAAPPSPAGASPGPAAKDRPEAPGWPARPP